MTPPIDPLSIIYSAMWDLLESSKLFTDLVKPANRIRFANTKNRDVGLKDQILDADLPEVMIISDGGKPQLMRTSSSSTWIRRWRIMVSTGDLRLDEKLFPVEWAVFCAMANWPAAMLALTYNDQKFVASAAFIDSQEGTSDKALTRGIRGWTCVFSGETLLSFATADIQEIGGIQ